MFTRRKPNKTGSISIQVIDKSRGRYHVVKSFGTGRTESELSLLERRANQYVREQEGLTLSLFEEDEDVLVHDFVSGISNTQLQVIGPELIFGRLYDRIGYGALNNEIFRHLVITRLFSPGSKLRTIDYLQRYQGVSYEISQIYRFLDNLCYHKGKKKKDKANDIKTDVERISFAYTQRVLQGKIEVVFYDMTTLYFEASEEDDLRKTGFSKDGKHQCPQIFLGLLVASGGNPIGYEIFEGDIFEGNTFIPLIDRMSERFSLDKPIVIADAGLLSKKNIEALEAEEYEYILGARPKNEADAIKEKILALGLKDGEIAIIDKPEGQRLIISQADNRARKDRHNRERGLARLQKRVESGRLTKASINNRGYNKYLTMDGEITIHVDIDKFESDAAWDGIKGYVTNTKLSGKEVIDNYKNLWLIERAFRMNKSDLRVRPIYHRIRNRIEAHICICFTAYTIMLELERLLQANQSSISLKRAQEITYNMYQLTYQLPNSKEIKNQILNMDEQQQELYMLVKNAKI
ncbi:MAG: IS1634 family transposase [Prevotella sp.]|jgi:transposase|nr:IS1634 family transposase [Prevotella sp.]